MPALESSANAGPRARLLPAHTEPAAGALPRRDTAPLPLRFPPRPLLRAQVVEPELLHGLRLRGLGRRRGAAHDGDAAGRARAEEEGPAAGEGAGNGGEMGGGGGGGREVEEGRCWSEGEEDDGRHGGGAEGARAQLDGVDRSIDSGGLGVR